MKKTFNYIALSVLVLSTLASCSSEGMLDDIENSQTTEAPKTCDLVLNVTKANYSDEPETRSASNWKDGDKIYLTFTTTSGTTYGDAVYSNEAWTVSYYGTLTEGTASNCKAVYFENADSESSTVVLLSKNTAVYEDLEGMYMFNDGTLSVTANLSPKTGRIRFAGNSGDSITVYGISHYNTYDASIGRFTRSHLAVKTAVEDEYTPYIYGMFTDSVQPRLNIITATSGYTKFPSTNIFKKGESGFMNVPSDSSHIGWQNTVMMKVKGVEFTMIPVDYSEGFFLLAETELTQGVYCAIMNKTTSTPQRPVPDPNYTDFLHNINTLTGLGFYIPTYKEWVFAYIGGNKSKGYFYSGSNIIDDVAWYSGNSNDTYHDVKQLQPNELGFYDMSGNMSEWTLNGNIINMYGGCYNSSKNACQYSSKGGYYGTLRMALKP